MAVIAIGSVAASPGATTTALGLTLLWPRDVILVDVDQTAAQAVQAGFLGGLDVGGRGLAEIAIAHREGRPLESAILSQLVSLTEGESLQRLFLPGFATAGQPQVFEPVWAALGRALHELDGAGYDVVLDLGRIGANRLPAEILERCDGVLLVSRSHLRALAALRVQLPEFAPWSDRLGLLLVGAGQPYSAREISAQFGVEVWGTLPLDEASAATLSDGAPARRSFPRSALARGLGAMADGLRSRIRTEVAA